METVCQLCSRRRSCRMRPVSTRHLHERRLAMRMEPFNRLTGRQGTATLSVCDVCAGIFTKEGATR